jgi:uncharacterized protein (TIGR03118 family)
MVCVLAAAAGSAFGQTGNAYVTTNLVSNVTGGAPVVDPNLVDPWGISISASSPFWVSDHLSGQSTLYNGSGVVSATVVTIPPGAASAAGALGRPTGQVQNNLSTASPIPFLLPAPNGKTASFIFCTDDGTLSAWNGSVTAGTAVIVVDNSAARAVYKGMAIATSAQGPMLYAANFRSGKIEAYNANWAPVTLAGSFTDTAVPAGFAPFNIQNLNGTLFVTYARQDANQYLDVAGAGNGYVAEFDLNGNLLAHLVSGGALNSPWGVAIAPASWGAFGGDLLVGNFGDGRINAYNTELGFYAGYLQTTTGNPIAISGLWALIFGNSKNGGDTNTLYFAAGQPNGGTGGRGLIGSIAPPAAITRITSAASELNGPVAPGEIITIEGQTVGPSPSLTSTIPTAGILPTVANGASFAFNGTLAPIVYAGSAATSIQVPYEISGSTTATVTMTVGTQIAKPFTIQVAPTAPAIFTTDFTGMNGAVALNADGTVNSASNPAARGSMITLFATGEGLTTPMDSDGVVETSTSVRVPVAVVSVTFSGTAGIVGTDASTPRDVSGVLMLNVTVPAGIAAGTSTVILTAGGVSSTQPTYVYLK